MRTVLITGSNGFIGSQIAESLSVQKFKLICFSKGIDRLPKSLDVIYQDVDFVDQYHLREALNNYKPEVVIHCAAISKVDVCENDEGYCTKINILATETLVRFSESCKAQFIYFSSDFVFDGSKKNISEMDIPNPISVYGKSKLIAEQIVQDSNLLWSIIRPVLVYGFSKTAARSNIFTWIYSSLKNGKSIQVVNDQIRTPTFVFDVVHLIELILNKKLIGIFNIGGSDTVSVCDFALKVAEICELDEKLIQPIDSELISGGELRPKYSCVDNHRIITELSFKPVNIEQGIRKAWQQIEFES
jgi:dTDP-4-dehydrorhamnose reductase